MFLFSQELEFHGVVRFFFQGAVGASVITKCIRVSSSATTLEVIDVLIEKFRPDMRMLSQSKYALYEVHVNGGELSAILYFISVNVQLFLPFHIISSLEYVDLSSSFFTVL